MTKTIPVQKFTWVDPMNCPFCNETTMFRYAKGYEHFNICTCTGPWDKSHPGCGFTFIHDCTPYKPYGQEQKNNFHYAKLLKQRKLVYDIPTGTLLPMGIIGNSMDPALIGGFKYVMQVMNNDMSEFVQGGIYSIILNGKPLCCRVYDTGTGFHLHKDNPKHGDMLVGYNDAVLAGRLLVNE